MPQRPITRGRIASFFASAVSGLITFWPRPEKSSTLRRVTCANELNKRSRTARATPTTARDNTHVERGVREHIHREQLLHVDDLAGGGGTRVGRLRSEVAEERVVLGHFNRGEAQELLLKMVMSVQLERDLQGVAEGGEKGRNDNNRWRCARGGRGGGVPSRLRL